VAQVCEGAVGAVFCLEASRLARNGRDWHHLLELCGLVGALVVDADGIYDPGRANDRLLLGLKGTMSEFELTTLRRRLLEAAVAKARRGELRMPVPVGYLWHRDTGLVLDPDRRIQDAIRTVFLLWERFGSARQVLRQMRKEGLLFPRPADGKRLVKLVWQPPVYRNVLSVLQNPFYAGAYAYGKSAVRTTIVDGRVRKSYGNARPRESWTVLLRDHHEGYVNWEQFEQAQEKLARNSFCKPGGRPKSARGGRALLAGLLRCGRCGRMVKVWYSGLPALPRYACRMGDAMHGLPVYISFGAYRPDEAIAEQILLAAESLAVQAAMVAESEIAAQLEERRRALELECEQARYEAALAARRYEAVDPDQRLVAAELEARWNAALARLEDCKARLAACSVAEVPPRTHQDLGDLAGDLARAWNAPATAMQTRQRLVRALIEEIVVDVNDAARDVIMVIHWRGGRHTELRVRKPGTGEHRRRASNEADRIIRDMATRWSDQDIAAALNRMGQRTGQGKTWTAVRVGSYRRSKEINGYESAVKDGRCLTMVEAAQAKGVTCHVIRRPIQSGVLPARQIMLDAPWQILAADLDRPEVEEALRSRRHRRGRPCRNSLDDETLRIPGT
jgi:DNA invertase Pin-like site-specific DNA recombinase